MNSDRLLVTTPTGNTGRHTLTTVLAAGRSVRILVRDPTRLPSDVRGACEVVVGDLRDPTALARALNGVHTAFFCVPQSPAPADLDIYYRSYAEPFATAARACDLRRVVTVSGGDGRPGETGPGKALQTMERVVEGAVADTRHVRCGYFMENLLYQAEALAYGGGFSLPLDPGVPLAFVAARDIGIAAGRLMDSAWSGSAAVEAYGPIKLTCAEAAEVLTVALSKPIRYIQVPFGEWITQLVGFGVSRAMATALSDMFAGIDAGHDMGRPPIRPVECPTTLLEWSRSVLAAAVAGVLDQPFTKMAPTDAAQ